MKPQPPAATAFLACYLALLFVWLALGQLLSNIDVLWVQVLPYGLIPLAAAYAVLQRSGWHSELAGAARSLRIFGQSCLVLAGVLAITAVVALTAGLFVYNFANLHY